MIDYKKQQNKIIDYINNNYPNYLSAHNINAPFLTTDYIDFDRFKNDFICFIEFDYSTFPNSKDDCGMNETSFINIYLTHRNNKPDNLNNLMLDSTSAFYEMFRDNYISGVFTQKINRVDFFKYIEGSNNIFCSKIVLELNLEI